MRWVLVTLLVLAPLAAGATNMHSIRVSDTGTLPGAGGVLGLTGAGATVAVLDTGVDNQHPAFEDAWVAGVDVSSGIALPGVTDPDDLDGHGTHVASVVLGRGGPKGVAPAANLVDVKVASDLQGFSVGGLAEGLRWVLDYNAGETSFGDPPPHRVDVAVISLATLDKGEDTSAIARLVDDVVRSGVTVVVAAGNCGPQPSATCGPGTAGASNSITDPGSAPLAITVAAIDERGTTDPSDDRVTPFSSRGPDGASAFGVRKPDLAAPGWLVPGADNDGGLAWYNGTSQAAPHVAGVVALLVEAKAKGSDAPLAPEEARRVLNETARDLGPVSWDAETGWGEVDALKAVRRYVANQAPAVAATAEPPRVALGGEVGLRATATDADGLGGLVYAWDVPWSGAHGGQQLMLVADQVGDHRVRALVTDVEGAVGTAEVVVTVFAPSPGGGPATNGTGSNGTGAADAAPPVARFVFTPASPLVNETVRFDASASSDDVGVRTYAWDLDRDGVLEAGTPMFETSFATPGVRIMRLTVADASGKTATDEQAVVVTPRPEADDAPDVAAPIVTLLRPAPGARLESPVRVEWEATDDVGVVLTTLVVDALAREVAASSAEDLDLAPGAHEVAVVAHDAAGREGRARVAFLVVEPVEEDGNATLAPGSEATPGSAILATVAVVVGLARASRRRTV